MDFDTFALNLIGGMRLPKPNLCPLEIWNVIDKCWNSDPDERPSFKELKSFLLEQYSFQNKKDKAREDSDGSTELTTESSYKTCYETLLDNQSNVTQFNAICELNLNYLSALEEKEMGLSEAETKDANSLLYLTPIQKTTASIDSSSTAIVTEKTEKAYCQMKQSLPTVTLNEESKGSYEINESKSN